MASSYWWKLLEVIWPWIRNSDFLLANTQVILRRALNQLSYQAGMQQHWPISWLLVNAIILTNQLAGFFTTVDRVHPGGSTDCSWYSSRPRWIDGERYFDYIILRQISFTYRLLSIWSYNKQDLSKDFKICLFLFCFYLYVWAASQQHKVDNQPLDIIMQLSIHGNVRTCFWWPDVLSDVNQLDLGKRHWNLATSSAEIEFRLRTITFSS